MRYIILILGLLSSFTAKAGNVHSVKEKNGIYRIHKRGGGSLDIAGRSNSELWVRGGAGHGSTAVKIRRFTALASRVGDAIIQEGSATDGNYFTIHEDGIYSIYFYNRNIGAGIQSGISLNATTSEQSSTNIADIPADRRLCYDNPGDGVISHCHITTKLIRGDVLRAHTNGVSSDTSNLVVGFRIIQLQKL